MKNIYYNIAKGVTAGVGIVTVCDAVRQQMQYNNTFTACLDLILTTASACVYAFFDRYQKLLAPETTDEPAKSLESKVEGKQMPPVIGFVPEKSVGMRQYHRPIVDERKKTSGV